MNGKRNLKWLGVLVAVIALLAGGIGITGAAAQAAIPGDALYGIKTTIENTRLSLSRDAGDRAQMKLGFAEQRLNEIGSLIRDGRVREIREAVLAFETHINGAIVELETVAQADPQRAAQLTTEVTSALTRYAQTLSELAASAPLSVRSEVDRALDTTRIVTGLDMPSGNSNDDNGNGVDDNSNDDNSNSNDDNGNDDNGNGIDDNGNSNDDDSNSNDDNGNGIDDDSNSNDDNGNGVDDNDDDGSNSNDDSGSNSNDYDGSNSNDDSGSNSNDDSGSNSNDDSGSNSNDYDGSNSNDDSGSNSNDDSGSNSNDDDSGSNSNDDSGSNSNDDSGSGNDNDDD